MTSKKTSQSALSQRLDELQVEPRELATIVRRPLEEVERWIAADDLGGEAAVLCRFLADADDAARRVEQLRKTYTRTLEGEGAEHAGVTPPYGGGYEGGDGNPVPTIGPLPQPGPRRELEDMQDGRRYGQ